MCKIALKHDHVNHAFWNHDAIIGWKTYPISVRDGRTRL